MPHRILSRNVYRGQPSFPDVKLFDKIEPAKSMQFEPVTVGSYGHADPTLHFTKESVVSRTANKRFSTSYGDFFRNGYFSQQDDYEIDGMKEAGEDNYSGKHDIIPRMHDIAHITAIAPVRMRLDIRSTPVDLYTTPTFVNAINPNNEGLYASKNLNNYLLLRGIVDNGTRYHSEAVAWIDFLAKKGFSIDTSKDAEITNLGVRVDVQNQGYIAAYHPTKGYLVTYADFHDKVKNLMAIYGLTDREAIEAMKRADMLHEIAHRLGIGGDAPSERLQGLLREEFYTMLAENFRGTKWERIYRALAREGGDYTILFSPHQVFRDNLTAELYPEKNPGPLELLIAKFEAEANALELTGERRQEYVIRRLEETYGNMLGIDPSFNEATKKSVSKSSYKKSAKKEGLERLIGRLRAEAKEKGLDEAEYISNELARKPIKYAKDGEIEEEKNYKKIDKSEYKSMGDVQEREARAENIEAKESTSS